MLELNSITFKDKETNQIVEVFVSNRKVISKNKGLSPDQFAQCCYHASLLLEGGNSKLKEFIEN